jgi:hypothetical protein
MAAAFPSVLISEDTIDVFARELYDVPLVLLRRATTQAMESCRFFPTIAELREKIDAMVTRQYQAPSSSCPKCFGSGWEQYRDDLNYNVARKCYH